MRITVLGVLVVVGGILLLAVVINALNSKHNQPGNVEERPNNPA
jgi:hypothetical protein